MRYDIKEYTPAFDIHYKKSYAREQELAIAQRIMKLLNDKKYDDLESFSNANESYSAFLKENHMYNVVCHFGEIFNDEEFKIVKEQLAKLTKDKLTFNSEDIKTTKFENTNVNTFNNVEKDKTHYLVDSVSNTPIEKQLENKQKESNEFQTIDKDVNTGRMMDDMEKRQKESLTLQYLDNINQEILTNEELEIYNIANKYQEDTDTVIRIDIHRGIIADTEDKMLKVENRDGVISIRNEKGEQIYPPKNQIEKQTQYVKTMIMPNAAA